MSHKVVQNGLWGEKPKTENLAHTVKVASIENPELVRTINIEIEQDNMTEEQMLQYLDNLDE